MKLFAIIHSIVNLLGCGWSYYLCAHDPNWEPVKMLVRILLQRILDFDLLWLCILWLFGVSCLYDSNGCFHRFNLSKHEIFLLLIGHVDVLPPAHFLLKTTEKCFSSNNFTLTSIRLESHEEWAWQLWMQQAWCLWCPCLDASFEVFQ